MTGNRPDMTEKLLTGTGRKASKQTKTENMFISYMDGFKNDFVIYSVENQVFKVGASQGIK